MATVDVSKKVTVTGVTLHLSGDEVQTLLDYLDTSEAAEFRLANPSLYTLQRDIEDALQA